MVLFYRQGQSVAEVAASLDLSEDAVKQRLSRGRTLLRDELATVVESTLTRTRPTNAFTVAVLAALPILAPTGVEAAVLAGAASSKGAGAAKTVIATIGKWAILGPAIGLIIGLLSSSAAASTGRFPEERACLLRLARRMVIFCWLMSIGLMLALLPAGKLYNPSPGWIIFGVLVWVAVLVGTILRSCSRADREVLRIRLETETDDETFSKSQAANEGRFSRPWLQIPYESKRRFLGLPLIAISSMGTDAATNRKRKAWGWIAIGDTAISPFFAFGGVAIAPLAIGGITFGFVSLSLWGIAAGALAFGSIALGWWSFGLAAIGWKAAAGGVVVARDYALGALARAAEVNTPAVKVWFLSQWFTVVAQGFLYSAHWLIFLIIVIALGRAFYNARQWRRACR